MRKRFIHPEGSEAFPKDAADEEALKKQGFVEEGYPKRMYREDEPLRKVTDSEERRVLGEVWVEFDEALRKIGGSYQERFRAARNDTEEQQRILKEYASSDPELASRDQWYLRMLKLIPGLQAGEEPSAARSVAKDRKKRRVTEPLDAETFHSYLRMRKEQHPKVTVRKMCVEVDRLPAHARTPPRKSWQAKSQSATWAGNYDHPKTKSSVKNFYSTVLPGNTPA